MASSSGSDNASTEKRSSKDTKNNKKGTSSSNLNRTENDFVPPAFSSDVIPHPANETVITEFGTIKFTDSMCLVVDLPIHGAQLHHLHKDGSTDDQAQKGDPKKVLKEKAKKKATQENEDVTKQQKQAQVKDNMIFMAKRLRYVFGDGSRRYTPRKRLCDVFDDKLRRSSVEEVIPIKRPTKIDNVAYNEKDQMPTENDIHSSRQTLIGNEMHSNRNSLDSSRAQLDTPLVSNKDGCTDDQAQKSEPEKILEEKAKKDAAQEKEAAHAAVAIAKQQKKAEMEENIRVMAKRLRYVFGDGSRTYTPRKRLCDVFGEGSRTSRPTKMVNTTYNEKDQASTRKETLPPQPLYGNRMHSDQNSYYSRIPPIKLTVDLPMSSPMASTTQGREVVVVAAVTPEEGVGDNIAKEQQAKAGKAIRDDVVHVVKYRRPDLNFLPPEEDDEDYYS